MFIDVKNWEGYYKINEKGEVLSVLTGKLKTPDKNSCGYLRITLQNKNHEPKIERVFLHRLVAMHFIPNPNNLPVVNHIDLNRENCSADNLEWCDNRQNELHSRQNGEKEYKPFKVVFNDGVVKTYHVKQDLADEIGRSRVLVKFWLHGKYKSYTNYNIKEICYI